MDEATRSITVTCRHLNWRELFRPQIVGGSPLTNYVSHCKASCQQKAVLFCILTEATDDSMGICQTCHGELARVSNISVCRVDKIIQSLVEVGHLYRVLDNHGRLVGYQTGWDQNEVLRWNDTFQEEQLVLSDAILPRKRTRQAS
jgi:hypothetical protein